MSWLMPKAQRYAYSTQKLTNAAVRQKRVEMFENEMRRQVALVTRIEKIKVEYEGLPEKCTLIMNKGLSTPFNCAMHMSQQVMERSVLALVNGQPWDMHRPLPDDCSLNFLHFEDEDPRVVNDAFWKSCSFILGHVLETAFKDKHYVQLCSFPPPRVESGSFVCDADLDLGDMKVTLRELDCLSRVGLRLRYADLRFQRLDLPESVAARMFEDNRFKSEQVPAIAAMSPSGSVPVYRLGDHVDMSAGPMISTTQQVGRYSVCAIHDIESSTYGKLQRVQGLAVPTQLNLHSWTYDNILRPRAAKLNPAPLPVNKREATRELLGE